MNSLQKVHCKHFNLASVQVGSNSCIIGRKYSGKSQLAVDIIQSRPTPPRVVVFSSPFVYKSYHKFFQKGCVYDRYSPSVLEQLVKEQQETDQELVLLFDDVKTSNNQDFWNDKTLLDVWRYGSSLRITNIMLLQYVGQITQIFQRNTDYVYLFRDNILANQRLLFDYYGGMFSTFEDFKQLYDSCMNTEPYRCIVINLTSTHRDPMEYIHWYKSKKTLVKIVQKKEVTSNCSVM